METTKDLPQPRWGILVVTNYLVLGTFIGTLCYLLANYQKLIVQQSNTASPLTNELFPIMLLWSLCLAYFFGFFGISFLDTEAISKSPSSFGLSDLQPEEPQTGKKETSAHSALAKKVGALKDHVTIPASIVGADVAPICSDKKDLSPTAPSVATAIPAAAIDYAQLTDDEVFAHLLSGVLKDYQLEQVIGDKLRAVSLRRRLFESLIGPGKLSTIPFEGYDYDKVFGANCEIVVGYVPLPVGIVGPLLINEEQIFIPMATTEGCLVASTNRGCKAISVSGGCNAMVLNDAITRAPCLRFASARRAVQLKLWTEVPENYALIEEAFNSTTNYGTLEGLTATVAGRNVYLRFCCMSGDAMGMNMVSKGCLKAIEVIEQFFPDVTLVAISGNMCTDKKPSAINWILGRGKSVVVEATISDEVVKSVLKSSVKAMIETNQQKNHIGSAMAGSIGGFNAHASNIVTAVFLATGQDPAQNVESSNCITIMEYAEDGKSLHVSVTMPSIEVGTVGGGTHLPAQAGCLDICGVRGASKGENARPGDNARKLAEIVGASVLAGELSLMAALAANHLVRSHMQHNRKTTSSESSSKLK